MQETQATAAHRIIELVSKRASSWELTLRSQRMSMV
jgi:hypothetical protein